MKERRGPKKDRRGVGGGGGGGTNESFPEAEPRPCEEGLA